MKINKLRLSIIYKTIGFILCFIPFSANAQTGDLAVQNELNSIFSNIDKSQIPSGYLSEYGSDFVAKNNYIGTLTESNFIEDITGFRFLYNDIYSSRIYANAPTLPTIESVNNTIDILPNNIATPLILLTAQYATLNESALNLGLFTTSNNQLYDVANRNQSPYIINQSFAAVPISAISKVKNSISLQWLSSLAYSNSNQIISALYIDFLDGQGFNTLSLNGTITKNYTDSSGYKKFIIKAIYTNGDVFFTSSQQYVEVNIVTNNSGNRYSILTNAELDNPNYIAHSNNGSFNDGKVYIRFSKKRLGTALSNKIVKPFIVVEGYDIHDIAPHLAEENYNINKLIKEWENLFQTTTYNFSGELDDIAGYDLIFIDYYTMAEIQKNARMLENVINWVNTNKVNNTNGVKELNVVMGISMGGLVSRYCLAQMTKENQNTDTRLLLTQDSPHQGANVPLGLQHFLYDFGDMKIAANKISSNSDQLKEFYLLNAQPATQSQLIARVLDGNGNYSLNSFLAPNGIYRQMVDFTPTQLISTPPSYIFKAVSQGSQCSKPVMPANTNFVNYDDDIAKLKIFMGIISSAKYKLTININSLPNIGSTNIISYSRMQRNIRFFFGLVGTGWKTTYENTRYAPSNMIPWDGLAGSTQSISGRNGSFGDNSINPSINNHNTFGGNLWRGFVYVFIVNVNVNFSVSYLQDLFSFVPINSSLDIANTNINTFNNSYIFPVDGNSGSTSTKYIAQEKFTNNINGQAVDFYNLNHTDFTKRNSKWIFNEMENLPDDVSCLNTIPCNPQSITFMNSICAGINEFSISNLSTITPVTYTVTPTNAATLQLIPPNKVKVFALGNVQYSITAQYTYCGNAVTLTSPNYQNAITATQDVLISNQTGGVWCSGASHTFTVNDFGENATYTWSSGANFSQTFLSADGKTVTFSYNGLATVPEPITCTITSYCFQNTAKTTLIDYLGNLVTKQIKTTTTSFAPLQLNNVINDNHAYVRFAQPGMTANNITYSLTSGFPDVWGSLASDKTQMFVFNRNGGGSYNFNANIVNPICGTTINIPFNITVSAGTGFTYQKIFRVAPNPVSTSTVVSVNPTAASNSFLSLCISSGAFIRVEVLTPFGLLQTVVNGAPFQQNVPVNISLLPPGLYFFRISAIGCPSNGVYQEVQQVQKL
jgi:hypothetical protein